MACSTLISRIWNAYIAKKVAWTVHLCALLREAPREAAKTDRKKGCAHRDHAFPASQVG